MDLDLERYPECDILEYFFTLYNDENDKKLYVCMFCYKIYTRKKQIKFIRHMANSCKECPEEIQTMFFHINADIIVRKKKEKIKPPVQNLPRNNTHGKNNVKGNQARLSLPTWLPRNPPGIHQPDSIQRPQSSIAHVNLGPNAQTYIVTDRGIPPVQRQTSHVSNSVSNESNLADGVPMEHPEINVSVNPANNNNIHDEADNDSHSEDGTQQVVDVRATLNLLIKYAPFYFILFIKFMYDSREAIFTFCVLFCTFSHSNMLVRREHGKQMNRSIVALFCELVLTSCTVTIIHFFCGHGRLLPNVVMFPGYDSPISVWELLWLVVLTDLIVKIITVNIKIIVTMMPAFLLPFQKRGKVYLFIESVSQLYRSLLTIQPWVFFLLQSYTGSEKMVGMFLTSIYVIAKVIEVLVRLSLFKNATWTLLQSVSLGTKPTGEQLLSAGDSCPICHDDYTTPVRLGCSHIFCELCISAWLDRDHTCPLCRAKVADEPTWRDGSTTYYFQLY